jgi:succinyl-diaminopimelate desuccinylase
MPHDAQLTSSIVALIQQLVRIPSRAGIDPYEPIADSIQRWLRQRGIETHRLMAQDRAVGLHATVEGAAPGPAYMLNATLDTAGFGDETRWRFPPTAGVLEGERLYGRGAADSKAGAALFCHLLTDVAQRRATFAGKLILLLDLDEHTGGFAGVRTYFDQPALPRPAGVYIGYPGNDRIIVGGRGFTRARITVHGTAAHSGSSRERGNNAVLRAAALAHELAALPVPGPSDAQFPLPAQLTVTALHGGEGYSTVPDACVLNVDLRLTPTFSADDARTLVQQAVEDFDRDHADVVLPTDVAWQAGWPPYRMADGTPMLTALAAAAAREFGRPIPGAVAGPSNIGNYLHTLGVPAIAGFGVTCQGIHATDEWIDIATVAPVYRTYRAALEQLLR